MSPKIRHLAATVIVLLLSCARIGSAADAIRMATTTSTENSGLLNALITPFTEKTGIKIHVIAVGSGKALRLGANGDVDLILVHAPAAEAEFVENGYGINRRTVMSYDYILAGPPADPASVMQSDTVIAALQAIAAAKALFISRGDDSGTHRKERNLWQTAEIVPRGDWYMEIGQGMEQALIMAQEKTAYILTDRGTYIAAAGRLNLHILSEGDAILANPYGIIAVNPERHPHVRYEESRQFIRWLTGTEGQQLINNFRVNGKQLFHKSKEAAGAEK